MNITRSSFMTGHAIGSVVQTTVSLVMVVGVALAVGSRSDATRWSGQPPPVSSRPSRSR